MIQVNQKQLVVSMLMQSFAKSERIRAMIRSSQKRHQQAFFNYIYEFADQVGNVFLSKDYSTTLVYYKNSDRKQNLKKLLTEIKLLFTSLSWRNLHHTLSTNKAISQIRSNATFRFGDDDYIYVWFLAGRELRVNYRGLYEALNHIRKESQKSSLPIYMETAVERMVPIYERAGFHFYKEYNTGEQIIYFGKYNCHA